MTRLFVAIDLPEALRLGVGALPRQLAGARWVPTHQLHLTLAFLGAVTDVPSIRQALAPIEVAPFELAVSGAGTFPQRARDPSVLWLGVTPAPGLLALKAAVDAALEPCGITPEHRAFHPHVTVARLKGTRRAQLDRVIESLEAYAAPPFRIDELLLYSSVLGPTGAEHTVEARYPLRAPPVS